ncbi:MAG: DNA replication/repair protein RecF [Schleiferiaceae bacterium]|nr:DNA replication/repair protein RecF [Schleiferiaceae bacterium]
MHINTLKVVNFKNYSDGALEFSDKINCFVGNNGVGKTNLLDAIHYLSLTKSYFNPIDAQNVRHEAPFFVVESDVVKNGQPEHIFLGVQKGQRKVLKRNQKEYSRLAEHIGFMPVVMISPSDRDLIHEGSETRRKFLDQLISLTDALYLADLMQYNKVLSARNALLKHFAATGNFDAETLEIYNIQLTDKAASIHQKRKENIAVLLPQLLHYYTKISGGKDAIGLQYSSQLDVAPLPELLQQRLQKDRALQYTTVGIHKDDLEITLGEFPLKKMGSQGQQKSFLIALKLAQFDFIRDKTGYKPILLLDDIFDKLDEYRVAALIALVNEHHFGQIFITDTHADRTRDLVKTINEDSKIFHIDEANTIQTI